MKHNIWLLSAPLATLWLTSACGDVNPKGRVPDYDYLVQDIQQGQIGDCWLLAVLGAFATSAPEELAYSLSHMNLPQDPGIAPRLHGTCDCGDPRLNTQANPLRPNWPAQVELALHSDGVDILHGNLPEDAAHFLHLDGGTVELWDDTHEYERPAVACTDDSPNDKRLWSNHCYVVIQSTDKWVRIYDPHGVPTLGNSSPYLKVKVPNKDLSFIGF